MNTKNKIKTADEIAELCEHLDGRENRRAINALFRAQDQSHLYPILGDFDATQRAIKRVQKYMRESGHNLAGLEYALSLEDELSRIVNSES